MIDYQNRGADHWDQIINDFASVIQELVEPLPRFNQRRNTFLDHLLARFSEDLSAYASISKWLTPVHLEERLIGDKIRMLKDGEYTNISSRRATGYDYTRYDTRNNFV